MKKTKQRVCRLGCLCFAIGSTSISVGSFASDDVYTSVSDNLVVYLPFEGNADDMSGYGNDGVVHGAKLTRDKVGEPDSAYWFDGSDDQIIVPNSRSTSIGNFAAGYTISTWIYPTDVSSGYHVIASKGLNGFSLRLNGSQLEACHHRRDGATLCQTSRDCVVSAREWTHTAVTWDANIDGNNWQMYLNGKKCSYTGTATGLIASGTGDISIGADDWYERWFFEGIIDAVHIYNRGLGPDDIYTLAFEMDDSLVAWYPFLGDADDLSGYGNDGALEGGPISLNDRFGNPNGAYYFDMNDDRVTAPDSPSTSLSNFQNGYTVAAWIFPFNVSSGYHVIASKGRNIFSLRLNGNKLEACHHKANGSTGCQTAAGCDVSAWKWSHVAVTWNGSTSTNNWQMYLNGTPCSYTGSADGLISSGLGATAIGADDWYERWYFSGIIDTVRMYNRGLSAAEVSTMTSFAD